MPTDGPLIALNARPEPRPVLLEGDDGVTRAATGARVAALVDHPPALVLTASCSSALETSAALLDLGPGDEVVVPAFTFPTSASPFLARRAAVRFADVDPIAASVTAETVAAVLTERTRAVVLTHYAGIGIDLGPLGDDLAERGIDVVEDAAHGLFASLDDRPLGRLGRFGCLSFHRTKNVSALDGGALLVNREDDVAAALVAVDKGTNRVAFDEGRVRSYEWMGLGTSARMSEGSLHYLAAELDRADAIQDRRRVVQARYQEALAPWAAEHGIGWPDPVPGRCSPAHIAHLVLPTAEARDAFVAHCAAVGVQAVRHYGSLPASGYGRTIRHPDDTCPVAARLADCLVRLPLHHQLSESDVDRVIDAVRSFPG